jgi:nitroreductase
MRCEKMLKDLILKNRSYRRFNEGREIDEDEIKDLVELARTSASAANRQPLKFKLSWTAKMNSKIFPLLKWAGYLENWDGPKEGQRPTGYVIILGDTTISREYFVDHGIMAQSMLLGAVEKGLGGCMIAAFDRIALSKELEIPQHLEPLLVVALGEPDEMIILEAVENGDIRYYRDVNDIHHVPKRSLDELIVK